MKMKHFAVLLLATICLGAAVVQAGLIDSFVSIPVAIANIMVDFLYLIPTTFVFTNDPDQKRTTCEIVQARGFPCKIHNVTTYAGYIVEIHRIPPSGASPANKKPVILQTGLIGTSADFIMATADVTKDTAVVGRDMGIELAKQGYDVWMANNRGNRYGLNHVSLKTTDKAFWDFTFQDIAEKDTPAIVDFVLNQTSADKVHFVGHSQGTAVMFALLSQTNAYNAKLASFTAISPITRIGKAATSFRYLIAALSPYLKAVGGPVFTENMLSGTFLPLTCDFILFKPFCEVVFFSVIGPDLTELEQSRMGVYLSKMPSSTSAKNLLHFNQLFKSDKFQKYDYGTTTGNEQQYGQPTAPEFPLTNITYPTIYVIYAQNDWFVPVVGVDALQTDLGANAKEFYKISDSKANHMDPLIGIHVAVEVNQKVLSILADNA